MTREKEITKEAKKFAKEIDDWEIAEDVQDAFEQGALWADEHPRWISVEDELPPYQEDVLICSKFFGMSVAWMSSNGSWRTVTGYPLNDNVIHWMFLPQAPKKGGEE